MIDQTEDDALAFGLTIDKAPGVDWFEVEPEAWPAVQAFLRVQTQWRIGPSGLIGLDYQALAWTFTLWSVQDPAVMLADIQVIESEVLLAAHEKEG